jgi:hypothetical protein
MRSFYILILLSIFFVSTIAIFSEEINAKAQSEAIVFINKLKAGNTDEILKEFGDNTCHCAPEGGYISYLKYESGHDPNLAFLLGHPFQNNSLKEVKLKENQPYLLPWDKPESVYIYVPIIFDPNVYSPLFIPLDMAYKKEISEAQLNTFLKDPSYDWQKAFTLRLRPTLASNLIGKPLINDRLENQIKLTSTNGKTIDKTYFYPQDASAIALKNGGSIPAKQMVNMFPKLKSVVLRLKIVRRGLLRPWTINKIAIEKGQILTATGKELDLNRDISSR